MSSWSAHSFDAGPKDSRITWRRHFPAMAGVSRYQGRINGFYLRAGRRARLFCYIPPVDHGPGMDSVDEYDDPIRYRPVPNEEIA